MGRKSAHVRSNGDALAARAVRWFEQPEVVLGLLGGHTRVRSSLTEIESLPARCGFPCATTVSSSEGGSCEWSGREVGGAVLERLVTRLTLLQAGLEVGSALSSFMFGTLKESGT